MWSRHPDAGAKWVTMLAHRYLRWWQESPVHQGEHEISRKTIAQGGPDRFGVPVVTILVCLTFLHTRLRARLSARPSLRPLISGGAGARRRPRAKAAGSWSCVLGNALFEIRKHPWRLGVFSPDGCLPLPKLTRACPKRGNFPSVRCRHRRQCCRRRSCR